MVLANKLGTLYGADIPAEALSQALDAQRKALVEAMLDRMEFNKKYVVELRQDYYEDPANNRQGYKAAVLIEECEK